MKRSLLIGLAVVGLVAECQAGTDALYQNNTTVDTPQIDATTVINSGTINAFLSSSSIDVQFFQTYNTLTFSNRPTGRLFGFPGFYFDFRTNTGVSKLASFANQGTISVASNSSGFFFFGGNVGGVVNVDATNILVTGSISAGGDGLVRLTAQTANLGQASIQASGGSSTFSSGAIFGNSYINPSGIIDQYWGAGTNQVMSGPGLPLNLGAGQFFVLPFAVSPQHQVQFPSGSTFFTRVPAFGNNTPFSAYAFTAAPNATNRIVQVVFLATNLVETNLVTSVRFDNSSLQDSVPVVEFLTSDFNPVTQQTSFNTLYFLDRLSSLTNAVLSDNFINSTRRPEAYELTRDPPFEWIVGGSPNTAFTNITFLPLGGQARVTNFYAGYWAQVGAAGNVTPNPNNPSLNDPTNLAGRVEIRADNLNLNNARLRADNVIIINTSNLTGNANTVIDAPIVHYNLANITTPALNLTNLVNSQVRRLNGEIFAWSGAWTNVAGGISHRYHVLILDASAMRSSQAVTTPEFVIRGTNVIMNNTLVPSRTFVVDSPSLTLNTNNQLLLSVGQLIDLTATNLPGLNYLTNLGLISITGEGKFASDRSAPMSNFVNSGDIIGTTHSIRSLLFDNSGSISAFNGPLNLSVGAGRLAGTFTAAGDMVLGGNDFKIRNHTNTTAGVLTLLVTNSITDNGVGANNVFSTDFGFNLPVKPPSGDLLGTTITSSTPASISVPILWAGENRGASRSGFSNNVALGRLVLRGLTNSGTYFMSGTGSDNAMYVDFLELQGSVSNNVTSTLFLDSNMTLYFANANIPVETLDGQLDGRLRWVKNYAGANSSVAAPTGGPNTPNPGVVIVNAALLQSTTIDSDADGIVNAFDLYPFEGVQLNSTVTFVNIPPLTAQISWEAAAETVYTIEYTTSLSPQNWQFLKFYTNSATANIQVTVQDPVPTGSGQRYYRVLYNP